MALILEKRSRMEPTADPTVSLVHDVLMSCYTASKQSHIFTESEFIARRPWKYNCECRARTWKRVQGPYGTRDHVRGRRH